MTKKTSKKQWQAAELGAIFNKNFAALVEALEPVKDKVLATGIDVDRETNKPLLLVFVDKKDKQALTPSKTVGADKLAVKVQGIKIPRGI